MKKTLVLSMLVLAAVCLGAPRLFAQAAATPGPRFDAAITKLFGDNANFSANTEFQIDRGAAGTMSMTGKMELLDGKSRFEMDLSTMQGGHLPPDALAHIKQMGMSKMVAINEPDKKTSAVLYPDLKACVQTTVEEAGAKASEYKMESTKIGTEAINGHPCVKNKVVVTGPDGTAHQSIVWNASDLKNFPVKIQTEGPQGPVTMVLKDVKLEKPAAKDFETPADYAKYDSMTTLMMKAMKAMPPPQ